MKKLKILMFMLLAATLFNSCSEDLADLNVNPDKSPTANPEEVFTSAIGYLAWVVDGQYNHDSFLWAQYWTWGPGVAIGTFERYQREGQDSDNAWIRLYANALTDLDFVSNSENRSLAGASKILTAYIYQGLVDHFGDVPFSEALTGNEGNFAPKFDDDASIYAALPGMIDEGIAELVAGGDMGAEDLVYNGDAASWIKFGNSLKLRILMRQSNVVDVSAEVTALVAAGNFIESAADIADIAFNGTTGDENPMWAWMEQGVKNFYVASNTSMVLLQDMADPRLGAFYALAESSGTYVGIEQGTIDEEPFTASKSDYSQMTDILYAADAPVILMSDWEVWFLRAEAANRFGTADDETSAFETAVAANFDHLDVAGAGAFIAGLDYAGSSDKMNLLAIQKWISMNGLQDDEGWIETRRFNTDANPIFWEQTFVTPILSVLPENVHPSSWLYPADELALNPNAPAQRSVTDKVFWDN
jgi:hypothetical protein